MSREKVEETVPKCDYCGRRGTFGQMMPWPHSGWFEVRHEGKTYDFHDPACAVAYIRERLS